jgi:hypothetical protein
MYLGRKPELLRVEIGAQRSSSSPRPRWFQERLAAGTRPTSPHSLALRWARRLQIDLVAQLTASTARAVFGVSPSAARSLTCRGVRGGATSSTSSRVAPELVSAAVEVVAAARAVWQPSGASSWVRPRPDHRSPVTAGHLEHAAPSLGGALVQGGAPGRRKPHWLAASASALVVVLVAAVVVVVPGPRVGRAPRVEDRRGSVPGPKGPGTTGAPALALTVGGVR